MNLTNEQFMLGARYSQRDVNALQEHTFSKIAEYYFHRVFHDWVINETVGFNLSSKCFLFSEIAAGANKIR